MQQQLSALQQSVTSNRESLLDGMKVFEEQINECRKDTLWKVQDIEQLLNNRISKQQVHDLIETLDVKLMTSLGNAETKLMEHLQNSHKEQTT